VLERAAEGRDLALLRRQGRPRSPRSGWRAGRRFDLQHAVWTSSALPQALTRPSCLRATLSRRRLRHLPGAAWLGCQGAQPGRRGVARVKVGRCRQGLVDAADTMHRSTMAMPRENVVALLVRRAVMVAMVAVFSVVPAVVHAVLQHRFRTIGHDISYLTCSCQAVSQSDGGSVQCRSLAMRTSGLACL
jgi:hypothetical protein